MSLFDIKPWLVKKNDGTKKQVMPQTTIKGVIGLEKKLIGLEKKLNSIETFIENLTGKNLMKIINKNISTLQQTASDFRSKVSGMETSLANANSKINDITSNSGGRNLWINSKSFSDININQPKVDWNTGSDGIATAHITDLGQIYGQWQAIYSNNTDPFTIGDSETFSVEMKGTGTIMIGRENDFEKIIVLNGNDWARYSVSGTVRNINRAHIIYNNSGKDCDVYVRLPMIEKGMVAHDWQPAPEDTDAKITGTENRLTQKINDSSEDFKTLDNKVMQNRGTVDSPDFNSLTQAGYYTITITSPANSKNYPTVNWGTLEVSGQVTDDNGRLNQKYVSDNNGLIYTRQYNNSNNYWTSWVKAANQNDINNLQNQINGTENRLTQKINDSNKGLFHFETVTGQTDPTSPGPYNKYVAIKAPNVPGYSFAFWLNSSTSGTVLPNYIDFPNFQQIGVWIGIPDGNTTPVKINACAVYVKSTVA